jgi:hypothetical protein
MLDQISNSQPPEGRTGSQIPHTDLKEYGLLADVETGRRKLHAPLLLGVHLPARIAHPIDPRSNLLDQGITADPVLLHQLS